MTVPASRVAPLLFVSGACALIYQVAWLRELRDVFGASTAASAAVLAMFMGGLGVGGLVLSGRIEKAKVPLLTYAHLELGIGVTACLTPFLVKLARSTYLGMGGQGTLGVGGATVVRLLLTALVLGAPTILMGGTLPAAARAATPPGDRSRRAVAILYGTNTIGAVSGALAANFLLLEIFGTRLTLLMAGLVNLLVGFAGRLLSRLPGVDVAAGERLADREPPREMPVWFPPLAAGISGFVFLLMEIVWYRMLSPLLGGSSYTFGLILAVALAGIGLGGVIYALRRPRPTLALFGVTCALEAACLAVPYALGDRLAVLAILLRPLGIAGFAGHIGAWMTLLAIVVFPTAIIAGFQFPLTIALFGVRQRGRVARHVALAYAANTAGSIAGSLGGGFGLLPLLSAPGCWRLAVWTLLGMAVMAAGAGFVRLRDPRGQLVLAWVFALLSFAMLRTVGPTAAWRHSPIGAGRVDPSALGTKNGTIRFLNAQRRDVRWEVDGVESTVGLFARDSYDFIINGKSDGSAVGDAPTQVMSGLLGVALRPTARTSLVVGLGTGSTAGWLAAIPEMESVDVVEIEPSMQYVAERCSPVNHDVLANPKVHVRWGDARESMLTSTRTYDLIFSEPSNPYRAGVSSFFTIDFYRSVKTRLSSNGIFLQWLQLYEVDGEVVRSVLATLGSVFAHVSIWETMPGDVLLVATNEPLIVDVSYLRQAVKREPLRSAMRAVWAMDDAEGFLAHHLANEVFAQDVQTLGIEPNTDDRNILEYAFARNVGRGGLAISLEAWELTRVKKTDRARTVGAVDWAAVEERRIVQNVEGSNVPAELRPFQKAIMDWRNGALGHALTSWRSWGKPPATLFERRLVAESLADAGDAEEAKSAIDALAAESPGEGHLVRARWLARTKHQEEAASEMEAGYLEFRSNPWMDRLLAARAFNVLATLAADPKLNERMAAAIGEPFAVMAVEHLRLMTRAQIVPTSDARCVEALRDFEPFVPWEEPYLRHRQECYEMHNAPLVKNAQAELRHFLDNAPNKL